MITDMKAKSLVAIPPQLAKKLSLRKGDLFDVTISEGNLILVPIVVRPRVEVEKMEKELAKFQAAEAKAEEEALAGDEGEEEEAAE